MSSIIQSTTDYRHQQRPFLRPAQDDEQAISWLNHARRRLREIRSAGGSQRAIRDAEAVVLDNIRIAAGTFWNMGSVPSARAPIVNHAQPATNLEAMSYVIPHVAPVGAGSGTRADPLMLSRNHGAYWCPWHGRYVDHDAASCTDGLFFESIGVSLAQFHGLGLQVPQRGQHRRNRQRITGQPSGGRSSEARGHQSQVPSNEYQPRGQWSRDYDRRPRTPPRRQHGRSRSPRRHDERSWSPRRRQNERSRSPRRQTERGGFLPRQTERDRSPRRQINSTTRVVRTNGSAINSSQVAADEQEYLQLRVDQQLNESLQQSMSEEQKDEKKE